MSRSRAGSPPARRARTALVLRFTVRGAARAALVSVAACQAILDLPEDPRLLAPWRCLDEPLQPAAPESATAVVRIQACDWVTTNCSQPVTGVTAALCDKKDVTCASPIRADIHDLDGEFVFEVNTGGIMGSGFDGYLTVSTPTAKCTDEMIFGPKAQALCSAAPGCDPNSGNACDIPIFTPSLLFLNPPVRADLAEPIPLPLIPTAAVQPLHEAIGRPFDPTTGYIFVTTLDCDGKRAAGVRLSLNRDQDRATLLYVESGVISAAMQTDESGVGGYIHVPAGFVEVSGSVFAPDQVLRRVGEVGLQVKPFTISYAMLAPSP